MRGAFAAIRRYLFALAQVSVFTLAVFARGDTFTVHSEVPDDSSVGLTDTRTINGLSSRIVDLSVTLDIRGGFNGDLYAYLRLDDQPLVVLLNRAGVDGQNSLGYADGGFQVTLTSDSWAPDIHFYGESEPVFNADGQLTGTWQADGRASPLSIDRGSLSSFNGLNPNGEWTLFLADRSAGETCLLESWTLNIVVPEPGCLSLTLFGVVVVSAYPRVRRKR